MITNGMFRFACTYLFFRNLMMIPFRSLMITNIMFCVFHNYFGNLMMITVIAHDRFYLLIFAPQRACVFRNLVISTIVTIVMVLVRFCVSLSTSTMIQVRTTALFVAFSFLITMFRLLVKKGSNIMV